MLYQCNGVSIDNLILNTDSYKMSMSRQYPPGTTGVFSYIESRGGRYDRTVFFGLQGFLQAYLERYLVMTEVEEAAEIAALHGVPFPREEWAYIVEHHKGRLPVVIRAVPEGTVVPTGQVLLTIENTDPRCYWLTTWLETALLRAIWYPTTVATLSWHLKQIILQYLEKTGDPTTIAYKLHDFGARGVSSLESAAIGGAAHLINFQGTDTISGLLYLRQFYAAPMAGHSVPAAEHSTITSWGREGEAAAYANMLQQFARPGAIVAVVSDSYDVFRAAEKLWGEELRQKVINSGALLVIRPDSGDPIATNLQLVEILGQQFGYTLNSKGYRLLRYVRLLQGDGVEEAAITGILSAFEQRGWSADNIAFGMGGGLLQKVHRDTQKFAMKCSAVQVDGQWREVYKDPITDPGKRSKVGRLELWYNQQSGDYITACHDPTTSSENKREEGWKSVLEEVYRDGKVLKTTTLEEVRQRANVGTPSLLAPAVRNSAPNRAVVSPEDDHHHGDDGFS